MPRRDNRHRERFRAIKPNGDRLFTAPDGFGFDSTRYGTLFVPQVALAILASWLAPKLTRRWSLRRVLLVRLARKMERYPMCL
jgi:hypothetical protein